MPIIELRSPAASPGPRLLKLLAESITEVLGIPRDRCWAIWARLPEGCYYRPDWAWQQHSPAPIVSILCKQTYSTRQVHRMLTAVRSLLEDQLSCPEDQVFIEVRRARVGELMTEGEVWVGDMAEARQEYVLRAIGHVSCPRVEATDDYWGGVKSVITLDGEGLNEQSLYGLETFSHLEVVYLFHKVDPDEVSTNARRPRGNPDWPEVGIFAQRAKGRPNRIGVSRCRLLSVEGKHLHVEELDAIDGTPVLDIKPYLREFGPRGEVRQPAWAEEVMRHYYD